MEIGVEISTAAPALESTPINLAPMLFMASSGFGSGVGICSFLTGKGAGSTNVSSVSMRKMGMAISRKQAPPTVPAGQFAGWMDTSSQPNRIANQIP